MVHTLEQKEDPGIEIFPCWHGMHSKNPLDGSEYVLLGQVSQARDPFDKLDPAGQAAQEPFALRNEPLGHVATHSVPCWL